MKRLSWNQVFPAFHSRENSDLRLPFTDTGDAMDKLRNEIRYYFEKRDMGKEPVVIGVTSTEYNEGAFQTSIELAKSYAKVQPNVLLIDMDHHKRYATRYLLSKKNKDLMEDLGEGIWRSREGFVFYQADEKHYSNGSFAMLRTQYDMVICSLPPVLKYADAGMLCREVDGIVYTVREYYTRQESILSALNYSDMIQNKMIGFMYYKAR